ALLLSFVSICWSKPTTVVNFSPEGDAPGVAPGFAYAFRAPAPLFTPTSIFNRFHPISSAPLSNHISAPQNVPTILKTQYHSQDLLGQYAFGYVGDASTAHEVRTLDGAVRGSYTYLDANGELQTANYIADDKGFRVEATNLPLAPAAPTVSKMLLPEPVKFTPEVEAATAAHLKAFAEIKASRKSKRSVPSKGYLPPPSPAVIKDSKSSTIQIQNEDDELHIPKFIDLPIPTKKLLVFPSPKKILSPPVPAPFRVPVQPIPAAVSNHSPIEALPAVLPQALFIKSAPQILQSLTPTFPLSAVSVPVPVPAVPVPSVPVPSASSQVLSQFHAQDELGGYEYGYARWSIC
ncbi:hypothetical protein SK128_015582, partial [Halocaridina rubra]